MYIQEERETISAISKLTLFLNDELAPFSIQRIQYRCASESIIHKSLIMKQSLS
jgi:hypothetical protein